MMAETGRGGVQGGLRATLWCEYPGNSGGRASKCEGQGLRGQHVQFMYESSFQAVS